MSNRIGAERGEKHRFNVTFMLFFRFCSRKCLIISHYIAIYWIFLRIFARIFKGRSDYAYLAENDRRGMREGVERWKSAEESRAEEWSVRKENEERKAY